MLITLLAVSITEENSVLCNFSGVGVFVGTAGWWGH